MNAESVTCRSSTAVASRGGQPSDATIGGFASLGPAEIDFVERTVRLDPDRLAAAGDQIGFSLIRAIARQIDSPPDTARGSSA